MSKKKKQRQAPPVETGKDRRAEDCPRNGRGFKGESDAPDGVSGNWS